MTNKKEEKINLEEAKLQAASKLLQRERAKLIEDCTLAVNEILNKYNCIIDVAMMISAQGTAPIVNIVPRPQQNPQ